MNESACAERPRRIRVALSAGLHDRYCDPATGVQIEGIRPPNAWCKRETLRSRELQVSCHQRGVSGAASPRLSSQEIARYISDDTMARIVIAVITMFILKIWLPY